MSTVATLPSPINTTGQASARLSSKPITVQLAVRIEREAAFVRWLEAQANRYASRSDEPRMAWLASHLLDMARDAQLVRAADGLELDARLEVLGRGHLPAQGAR